MCNYICYVHHEKDVTKTILPLEDAIYQDAHCEVFTKKQPLSQQMDQFFESEQALVIFQGDLYNYDFLSPKMNDSHTVKAEAELIEKLYVRQGVSLFNELKGKFSIIIWDKEKQELFAANDHFGMKTLYYKEAEQGVYFSTQKKPLALLHNNNQVSKKALQHYLSFQYVPDPFTMTKGIKTLASGHYLTYEKEQKIITTEYWRASFHPIHFDKKEITEKIFETLSQSVHKHTRGNNKRVGTFLSGGIDSTIIASMMTEIVSNLNTFSVGFESDGFSEVEAAKETAHHLGVNNISCHITSEEYVKQIPRIIWHLEDPLADPSCIPLYFVARLASDHVDTALSGEGADELFGGYNIYREPKSLKVFDAIPKPAKSLLGKIAELLPDDLKGKSFLQRGTTPLQERYIGNAKIFEEMEKKELLKQFNPDLSYQQITKPLYDRVKDYSLVHQMQYIDIHTWLRGDILFKAEKMSAANNIDVRMPFLDMKVFNIARKIAADLKITDGTTKKILREAMHSIVPRHVLHHKKLGFPVPIKHWLKNELYDWARTLIIESETEEFFVKANVLKLLEKHRKGKTDLSRKIWTVLVFMIWHQIFIEGKYSNAFM